MTKIVIVGQGVAARVLASYVQSDTDYQFVGYTVDDEYVVPEEDLTKPCVPLSKLEAVFSPATHSILLGVGYAQMNQVRTAMFHRIKERGYAIKSFVHSRASVASHEQLGEGCILLPGVVVEPYAKVGENSVLWSNVTVAHHSTVGSNCWLASGSVVSGQAKIGNNSFLGVNSTIVNEIEVGDGCFIGAGALVTKSTKSDSVHIARSGEMLRYPASEYSKFFM